jgi:hypothetical protein
MLTVSENEPLSVHLVAAGAEEESFGQTIGSFREFVADAFEPHTKRKTA